MGIVSCALAEAHKRKLDPASKSRPLRSFEQGTKRNGAVRSLAKRSSGSIINSKSTPSDTLAGNKDVIIDALKEKDSALVGDFAQAACTVFGDSSDNEALIQALTVLLQELPLNEALQLCSRAEEGRVAEERSDQRSDRPFGDRLCAVMQASAPEVYRRVLDLRKGAALSST